MADSSVSFGGDFQTIVTVLRRENGNEEEKEESFVVTGGRRKGNQVWKEIGYILFLAVSTFHYMKAHCLRKKSGRRL